MSTSTASLANMTSGTTFAAKARAAELNAVRARKGIKDNESEIELPTLTPVSLGAIKFTKPRNRGRAWKALNLNDLPEVSSDTEEVDVRPVRPLTPPYHKEPSQVLHPPSYQTTELSPESLKLAKMVANFDLGEWDPDIPSAASDRSISLVSGKQASSPGPSRSSSVLTLDTALERSPNTAKGSDLALRLRQRQAAKIAEVEAQSPSVHQRLGATEEAKLTGLGVLPSVPSFSQNHIASAVNLYNSPYLGFSKPPQMHVYGNTPESQQLGYDLDPTPRALPSAVKGTMNFDFRFPPQWSSPHAAYQEQYNNPQDQLSYFDHGTGYQQASNASPYQVQHLPFAGGSASSKKDMLLQNLHDVVESSKAQGGLLSSTRTVLYDPLAKQGQNDRVPDSAAHIVPSKSEIELLNTSDPLPWKDRPVDIYSNVSPAPVNATHAALNKMPTSPIPVFPIDSSKAKTRQARSLEEVELWWKTDARGQGELRSHLEKAADKHRIARKSQVLGDAINIQQRRNNLGDGWDEPSTPGQVAEHPVAGEVINRLMIPILGNLQHYLGGPVDERAGYFGRFARVPEWCIDKSSGGQASFFGEDWGAPPPRVGRDPRYRPILHEGRYTVFEEMDRRSGRDGVGRRFR